MGNKGQLFLTEDFQLMNAEGTGKQKNRKPPLGHHSDNCGRHAPPIVVSGRSARRNKAFAVLKYLPANILITREKQSLYSEEIWPTPP